MLALKYLLMILGAGLFGSAGALVAYDIFLSEQLRRLLSRNKTDESGAEVEALARRPFRPVRWRLALQLTAASALAPLPPESFAGISACAKLRDAGDLCHEARRIADKSGRIDCRAAGERRDHREESVAARSAAPCGIRQGA